MPNAPGANERRSKVPTRPIWEEALLSSVDDAVRADVEDVLACRTIKETRAAYDRWMTHYVDAEMSRPLEPIVAAHEFGGHLRPLFAHYYITHDESFIEHCKFLFAIRRDWAKHNLHQGYCDGHEVHHEPETFLYFQIPLLDVSGDPEVLESVEDVAAMAGNWAEDVPEWYDWDSHGFRSTWLGSREVRGAHPHDYQEANHWRIIAIVLAAHRQGAGAGRYLDLARDYAERWTEHIDACVAAGRTINMQILPDGAVVEEMGHAGAHKEDPPPGVYRVFYTETAANTAYDVGQGLQDVYRLTGDRRFLAGARAILEQYRAHADSRTGRWPVSCSGGEWKLGLDWTEGELPCGHGSSLLAELALRQQALGGDAALADEVLDWAEAVLVGDEPRDAGCARLLLAAFVINGDVRFLIEGYRRLTAGLVAVFGRDETYHCCNAYTRPGFGMQLDMPWLVDAGLVGMGTRGSWPMEWAGAWRAELIAKLNLGY